MFALDRLSRLVVPTLMTIAVVCLLAGCGKDYSGSDRSSVTGTVTLDGKPLPFGTILFMAEGASNRMASVLIENGSYTITEAQGPNVGEYQVQITGYAEAPASVEEPEEGEDEDGEGPDPDAQTAGPQIVPAKYNMSSELKATIVAGPNVHNFDLTTQ